MGQPELRTFMMASARFSARSDFSGIGGPRGNFVYDGANGPLPPLSATAFVYDSLPELVRLYSAPLATFAPSRQFAWTGSYGAHLPTTSGAWSTDKKRAEETGLDYFQKRYLSSAQGRFTSPDPVGIITQKLFDPQQWNMYSYVRNNPLRLLDPTGEYVANCGDDVKNCDKQIQQFEKTRLQALKSKDEKIQNAAGAYGALGDKNGVNLTIAKVVDAKHSDVLGTVSAQAGTGGLTFNGNTNTFQQATQVTIQSGLSGNTLEGVLVHEGTHVEDRANFVNSISLGGAPDFKLSFNPALNITGRQSEFNAYGVENNFLRSIGQPQRNIRDILAHPPYSDNPNIDKRLFIDIGKPQQ
jgi:RHS repeat-associated protein